MMKTLFTMLVAILLIGCAQTPMQVDVSDSAYEGIKPTNSPEHRISELVIVNKAEPGKKHSTGLGSDSIFPIETAPSTKDIVQDNVKRYFNKLADGQYQIKKSIREMLVFASQDVIKDPPFTKLDILSCRNLLIYLGLVLQKRLFPIFNYQGRQGKE